MESKICSDCQNEKPLSDFAIKNKSKGNPQSKCKECHKNYRRKHYLANKPKYLKKAHNRRKDDLERNKKFIFDYLEDKECEVCGEDDSIVLEFDHLDPAIKINAIAIMIRNCWSINNIKIEIEKCQILCANCHRRKTAKQFGWYKYTNIPVQQVGVADGFQNHCLGGSIPPTGAK